MKLLRGRLVTDSNNGQYNAAFDYAFPADIDYPPRFVCIR